MAKRLKCKRISGYPHIDNKIKTTKAPLIGFEWEVPCDWDKFYSGFVDYDEDDYCVPTFVEWSDSNGFFYHSECGCWEFASPVANSMSVARRAAKHIVKFVKRVDFLGLKDIPFNHNNGGIHVSVSNPKGEPYSYEHFDRIYYMINRESARDFIWEFSGRGLMRYSSYSYQAKVSGWDDGGPEGFSNEMIRRNVNRIEYRLWCNFSEFLIPAIEFAHSTFLFTKDKNYIPTMKEYKDWLFKQKGYKALKNFEHADWSLIND